MKRLDWRKAGVVVAFAGALLSVPAGASAALLGTYQPSPADLNDLDHHMLYTWRIEDPNLVGKTVTSATITFSSMYNWDTSGNILYMWLLDSAYLPGTSVNGSSVRSVFGTTTCATQVGTTGCVTQFTDDSSGTPTLAHSYNDFGGGTSPSGFTASGRPRWLVSPDDMATARDLSNRSFAGPGASPTTSPGPSGDVTGWTYTTPSYHRYDYTYTFSAGDLTSLNAFLSDDVFALGLDPDCHYYNNGITLTLNGADTPPSTVPEPTSLLLLGTGVALLIRRRLMRP